MLTKSSTTAQWLVTAFKVVEKTFVNALATRSKDCSFKILCMGRQCADDLDRIHQYFDRILLVFAHWRELQGEFNCREALSGISTVYLLMRSNLTTPAGNNAQIYLCSKPFLSTIRLRPRHWPIITEQAAGSNPSAMIAAENS